MGVVGDEVVGADFSIGEVAASATGHKDLFAGFIGMVEYGYFASTFAGFYRA